jgi:2-phosphosulfolactate phosphatase
VRVHVAFTPTEVSGDGLKTRSVAVVDVLRAATTVATAIANGALLIVPVLTPAEARERAARFSPGEVLIRGERDGEPISDFDLGNSPLEYTSQRVTGKVVILTTTNGTRALVAASDAPTVAVCAFVNLPEAARWVLAQNRDLTVICAGESGGLSLEDSVCAGMLLDRIAETGEPLEESDAARVARVVSARYRDRLDHLLTDSTWAGRLTRAGRADDVAVCLRIGTLHDVPLLRDGAISRSP